MTLAPVDGTPGLWRDPDLQPDRPGAFAVVIGVSTYDYLEGGGGRPLAADTFGLGQLFVSALTAQRFFNWLRTRYRFPDSPLVSCWRLLAPTADELTVDPSLAEHALAPTFLNCRTAIRDWFATMDTLGKTVPDAAARSRSFFFFSGHGMEVTEESQILLPCDYLAPPAGSENDAISLANLRAGTHMLKVPQQFFFSDACRNDNQALRNRDIDGSPILSKPHSSLFQRRMHTTIYASTAGDQAFQPRDPRGTGGAGTLSLFGQAMLAALTSAASPPCDPTVQPPTIRVSSLELDLKQRLEALLVERQRVGLQEVRVSGDGSTMLLTEVDPAAEPAAEAGQAGRAGPVLLPPVLGPLGGGVGGVDIGALADALAGAGARIAREAARALPGKVVGRAAARFRPPEPTPRTPLPLGADAVRHLAATVRLSRPAGDAAGPSDAGPAFQIADAAAIGRNGRRVELRPVGEHAPGPTWVEVDAGSSVFAAALPISADGAPRFRLSIFDGDAGTPVRVDADLSPAGTGLAGQAARCWERLRTRNADAAAEGALAVLRAATADTPQPLAATVAALALAGANRWQELGDRLPGLVERFPDRPDPLVLEVERRLRIDGADPAEAARRLLGLTTLDLPATAPALGYAHRQLRALLEDDGVPAELRDVLAALDERVRAAVRFFRPGGGLFAVYAGPRAEVGLDLVRAVR